MREDQADQLIAAVKENTAALLKVAGGTTGGGKPAPGAATSGKGATISFEMLKAALIQVRTEKGKPAAQKIIKDIGKADESAGIKPAQYKAVMDACKTMLEPDEAADEPTDDDDTL